MSDEEKSDGSIGTATAAAGVPSDQPSLDEHTTEPNAPEPVKNTAPEPSGKWQMPKPKFQQTSGYLPQGYLRDVEQDPSSFAGSEDTTQEQAPFAPEPPGQDGAAAQVEVAVEPQPDLSDQLIPDETSGEGAAAQAAVKRGSSLPMIAFGLIGIVVFLVAFLAAVYFLFLATPSGGNNF